MKGNLLVVVLSLFAAQQLLAQKIEISVQANSGLFHYSGNATVATSYITEGMSPGQNYTNNPYGNKNGVSYGAGIQAKYVTKGGFIAGLDAGYDILRSKVNISNVYPFPNYVLFKAADQFYYPITTASGHTIL
jgi:hypothetical protein